MTQVYAVFHHGWCLQMVKPHIPKMLHDPKLNGKSSFSV
jgi:hypothetical protein